jgi:hypothetical protein
MSEVLDQESGTKGGFFAVDSRTWTKVCQLGLNEPVSYLVQARGTGRDNRTTTWSVESIERYTGISRHRATAAVKKTQDAGLTRLLRGGTKPKYDLVPFNELPFADPRPELSGPERLVLDWVRRGIGLNRKDQRHARSAAKKGWLHEREGEFGIAPAPETQPDLIWLPNELVTGALDEIPPLELVRQTQDPMTLRLLVDLYHAHNLREDGGVARRLLRQEYERHDVGHQGPLAVWGFRPKHLSGRWEGPIAPHQDKDNDGKDLWRRVGHLQGLGLLDFVPHLIESVDECGEIIHPLSVGRSDTIEDRLGRAAHEAGRALVTEGQYEWAINKGIHHLVPVPRHIGNVQMIGIARLRYRPHTRMTAAWWADLNANAEKHLARYAAIAAHQNTRMAV